MNWLKRVSKQSDRLARWSFWLILANLSIWLVLGLLAALFGGPLTTLGSGPGGAWGVADLLLGIAMLLALPSLFVGIYRLFRRRSGAIASILAYVYAVTMFVGYILIAHTLDPCVLGIWTTLSKLGTIPLCEMFGAELNIHTRFHLLWHVLPTLPLLAVYGFVRVRLHHAPVNP